MNNAIDLRKYLETEMVIPVPPNRSGIEVAVDMFYDTSGLFNRDADNCTLDEYAPRNPGHGLIERFRGPALVREFIEAGDFVITIYYLKVRESLP